MVEEQIPHDHGQQGGVRHGEPSAEADGAPVETHHVGETHQRHHARTARERDGGKMQSIAPLGVRLQQDAVERPRDAAHGNEQRTEQPALAALEFLAAPHHTQHTDELQTDTGPPQAGYPLPPKQAGDDGNPCRPGGDDQGRDARTRARHAGDEQQLVEPVAEEPQQQQTARIASVGPGVACESGDAEEHQRRERHTHGRERQRRHRLQSRLHHAVVDAPDGRHEHQPGIGQPESRSSRRAVGRRGVSARGGQRRHDAM